jgi:hypothetical protein
VLRQSGKVLEALEKSDKLLDALEGPSSVVYAVYGPAAPRRGERPAEREPALDLAAWFKWFTELAKARKPRPRIVVGYLEHFARKPERASFGELSRLVHNRVRPQRPMTDWGIHRALTRCRKFMAEYPEARVELCQEGRAVVPRWKPVSSDFSATGQNFEKKPLARKRRGGS